MKKLIDNRIFNPFKHDLKIRESQIPGAGDGLFTFESLKENTYLGISHVKGDIKMFEQGLIRTGLGSHINHSDTPNCIIVDDGDYKLLVTKRNIIINEELTTDYTKSECGCEYISKIDIV